MGFKNNPGSDHLAVVRIWDRNGGSFSDMMVCRDGVLDLDREKVLDRKCIGDMIGERMKTDFSTANDNILECDLRKLNCWGCEGKSYLCPSNN